MKKIVAVILSLMLIIPSFSLNLYAEHESVFDFSLQEKIMLAQEQRIQFKIDENIDINNVNFEESKLTIINDAKNTKEITAIKSEEGKYYFSFSIDDSYKLNEIWRIAAITLAGVNNNEDIVLKGDLNVKFEIIDELDKDEKNDTSAYEEESAFDDSDSSVRSFVSVPAISNVNAISRIGQITITAEVSADVARIDFPTWTAKDGQDDMTWMQGTINGNIASYVIDMKDHNYEIGDYYTHIYAYDSFGNILEVIPVNSFMSQTDPKISNVTIEKGNGKYTVSAKVEGYNIQSASFPTWTDKDGQDDLTWEVGKIEGNEISYTVDMSQHNYETGIYHTHIYVYDSTGKLSVAGVDVEMKKTPPVISDITVQKGNGKYTVSAKVNGYNIQSASFPTWTNKDGQDDLTWGVGKIEGNVISYTVDMSQHNYEIGLYHTHIYVYDGAGNVNIVAVDAEMSVKTPEISNVRTTKSDGRYKITADVKGYNIKSAQFPTWTDKDGQDDLTWGIGYTDGHTISYEIDMKDHNYETGLYHTHIYVYDGVGNQVVLPVDVNVENKPPVIRNISVSDISTQGYLVTCVVEDGYGIDQVQFPTWTTLNGQDDIVWGRGTIEGNKVSFRVKVLDHGYNYGEYQTHIYAYDKAGLYSTAAIANVFINTPVALPGWKVSNGNKALYDSAGSLVGEGLLIIDISEHNGNINWEAVKNAGVDGVILRSSYGYDYDGGGFNASQMDKKFKYNVSELNRLGIPYGIYHFTYARYNGEGALEANYLLDCLKAAGARPTLPIYYDLESSSYVGDKSNSFYTQITKEFTDIIKGAGYSVGVYANNHWWTSKLTDPSFNSYVKWVAHYGTDANNAAATANPYWHPGKEYRMWQYSSCGRINGISTNVDINIMF